MAQALQQRRGKHGLHVGAHRVALINFLQGRSTLTRSPGIGPFVHHAHQILFVDERVFPDELARHAPILRQHQQAHRVDIESPRRRQATQVRRRETQTTGVFAPVGARVDEGHRRCVSVFGLSRHIAHGLVQHDGDLVGLLALCCTLNGDLVLRRDLDAHFRDLTVHVNPAVGYPVVGLAARAQAQVGQALVQARSSGC